MGRVVLLVVVGDKWCCSSKTSIVIVVIGDLKYPLPELKEGTSILSLDVIFAATVAMLSPRKISIKYAEVFYSLPHQDHSDRREQRTRPIFETVIQQTRDIQCEVHLPSSPDQCTACIYSIYVAYMCVCIPSCERGEPWRRGGRD